MSNCPNCGFNGGEGCEDDCQCRCDCHKGMTCGEQWQQPYQPENDLEVIFIRRDGI